MSVNVPDKMPVPFADAGLKNAIPPSSDNVNGLAGYNQGFPPINMTPKTAGGIPPFGQDMNGILFAVTEGLRFFQAGSIYTYDSTFSTAVGGYRAGARVLRTDGSGYWLNLTDANSTDPESAGAAAAGWVPDFTYGMASVTMTNSNVTLTPNQYGKPIIVISGALTANLNLIFPSIAAEWSVINNTTGAFSITCKTAAGTGIVVSPSVVSKILGDGTNILSASPVQMASETVAGIIEIATDAEAQSFTANKAIDGAKLNTAFKGGNQSFAVSGWQKLPGGLIMQWVTRAITGNGAAQTATFPMVFPNACLAIIPGTVATGAATFKATEAYSVTTSGFSFNIWDTNTDGTTIANYNCVFFALGN